MKKILFSITVLAAIVVACNTVENNITPNESASGVQMITETISGRRVSTKATIAGDASFSWTVGDDIAVHVSNGKYVYTSDDGASGASADAATASFTVVYPEGYARDAFALFPSTIVEKSAANYGQSGTALDVTLPASYTLAQTSNLTSPCPMIATNATGSGWEFYQLCGLLRLTVYNIPPSTKRLEFDFDGMKVSGAFSIATPVTPGTSVIASTADASHDVITIVKGDGETLNNNAWLDKLVLNIPLPTGTYTSITATAYDAVADGNALLTTAISFAYTATNQYGTQKVVSFPFISVSADKRVIFAPGNLQYLGNAYGTGTWRFAEHQYDFMGDGPTSGTNYQGNVTVAGFTKYNASADMDVARDLFGWGTSGYNDMNPYMTSTSSGSYYSGALAGTDYDWGVYHSAPGNSSKKITNGGNYAWRLFTGEEFSYAVQRQGRVYTRTDSPTYSEMKDLFASATVVGVKGIILFPDNWDGSLDRTIKYGNASEADYDKLICDVEKWASFEKAGCVFLPAAGYRSGNSMNGLNTGNYWASTTVYTAGEYRGGTLEWTTTGTVTKSSDNASVRYLGQSVRLIRDLE